MPMPPRCPNPSCPAHAPAQPPSAGHFRRKGAFRRRDLRCVPRFQCKRCGRNFSSQTLEPTWRRRRCDVDEPLRMLLARGTSLRAAARLLGVNRKTVERRARDPRWLPSAAPGDAGAPSPQPLS